MADELEHSTAEGLDNPLRAIIVVNSKSVPEGEMEERMLDQIQTFEEVEAFFDKFDEAVAYPNEDHIKYEVGSDGLVIFVVDSLELKSKVMRFLDDLEEGKESKDGDAETGEEAPKKKKKTT